MDRKYKSGNQISESNLIDNDEIDVIQIIEDIKKGWLKILIGTVLGCVFALLIALSITKEYKVDAVFTFPNKVNVELYNANSNIPLSKSEMFAEFYTELGSAINLREYLETKNMFESLYPDSKLETSVLLDRTLQRIDVSLIDTVSSDDQYVKPPIKGIISMTHSNEKVVVELLNDFLDFTSDRVIESLKKQSEAIRKSKISELYRELEVKRESVKMNYERKIKIKEENNKSKIELLEQQVELEILKIKQDRLNKIAKINEENTIKLNELHQEFDLLIQKAKDDRTVAIARKEQEVKLELDVARQEYDLLVNKASELRSAQILLAEEALVIATELSIELPTSISEFNASRSSDTTINLFDTGELPLYLMGEKYLKVKIKNLKERSSNEIYLDELQELHDLKVKIDILEENKELEHLKSINNDENLLPELNALNKQMSKIKNDERLKVLKNSINDEFYSDKISDLRSQISQLKDDKELVALKAVTDFDLYIEDYSELMVSIKSLESKGGNLDDVWPITIIKHAIPTNRVIKPNRLMILAVGALLFFFTSIMWVVYSNALKRRGS